MTPIILPKFEKPQLSSIIKEVIAQLDLPKGVTVVITDNSIKFEAPVRRIGNQIVDPLINLNIEEQIYAAIERSLIGV